MDFYRDANYRIPPPRHSHYPFIKPLYKSRFPCAATLCNVKCLCIKILARSSCAQFAYKCRQREIMVFTSPVLA